MLQRWEFFIGDPPQPKGDSAAQAPRPPIAQLRFAEHYAVSGAPSWLPTSAPMHACFASATFGSPVLHHC
jgi:hypothetical protein